MQHPLTMTRALPSRSPCPLCPARLPPHHVRVVHPHHRVPVQPHHRVPVHPHVRVVHEQRVEEGLGRGGGGGGGGALGQVDGAGHLSRRSTQGKSHGEHGAEEGELQASHCAEK